MSRYFEDVWGEIDTERTDGAVMGGHAYFGKAVECVAPGIVVARDGESRLMEKPAAEGIPGRDGAGVVARADKDGLEVTTDATGVFPVFYATVTDGILVSTLLRPLARVMGASPDPVGIAEFLRFANTFDNRSFFAGIRRLGPGQRLTWSQERGVGVSEMSRLWTSLRTDLESPDAAAEAAEPLLRDALRGAVADGGPHVLMMSAGWDSRTLLASLAKWAPGADLSAFSHGDLESRELRIARGLSELAGISWRGRRIDRDVWNAAHLTRTFARTETLLFPHWAWAGLENRDAGVVSSGVLGEVLGGHYGSMHMVRGGGKVLTLLKGLSRGTQNEQGDGSAARERAEASLALRGLDRPWYLAKDVEEGRREELLDQINQDIANDLYRLEARGVWTTGQMIEAFVTEHRGAQYIAGQARALRVATDTGVPYAHGPLMDFASSVPPSLKIHNRVNRSLGLRVAPSLSQPPMAATLVPGTWPLLAQEVSRVVRRAYEDASWRLYAVARGRTRYARLGWVDFEFLRDGTAILDVAETLRADVWDRQSFRDLARRVRTFRYGGQLHPVFDQMGKILTVDRYLV